MKPHLLYPDQDLDIDSKPPSNDEELIRDLGLDTLFDAMANGDPFLREAASRVVLQSVTDPELIRYRQHILADCLKLPELAREIYDTAVEAIAGEKRIYRGIFSEHYPELTLHRSVEELEFFVTILKKLRDLAAQHRQEFQSQGFRELFDTLPRELDDDYFGEVARHLRRLRFRKGVLISTQLGKGYKGHDYILRRPNESPHPWLDWLTVDSRPSYSFRIADRDEAGSRALAELRGRGIDHAANALAQSADHILSFFTLLRSELGFYIACVNVHNALSAKRRTMTFPQPLTMEETAISSTGLYDVNLGLRLDTVVVGNDLNARGKSLIIITGANQGGKSTFLRAVGLAQLMMQCGMFVAADSYSANTCARLFTHYKREEDATMESGKFDEELKRMSKMADEVKPHGMVLFNESFAATNEREGSEIARQIVRALLDNRIKVFFVTHFYDLANSFYRLHDPTAAFLRAEREEDGRRTFRLVSGQPLPTSYGPDLYQRTFGADVVAGHGCTGVDRVPER